MNISCQFYQNCSSLHEISLVTISNRTNKWTNGRKGHLTT